MPPAEHLPRDSEEAFQSAIRASNSDATSVNRQARYDFLRRALGKIVAVAKILQFPLEYIAKLGLLVYAELVLGLVTNRSSAQAFQYHLYLVLRAGVSSSLGGGWKPSPKIVRQTIRELFQIIGVQQSE
jgi:hypothetical protein